MMDVSSCTCPMHEKMLRELRSMGHGGVLGLRGFGRMASRRVWSWPGGLGPFPEPWAPLHVLAQFTPRGWWPLAYLGPGTQTPSQWLEAGAPAGGNWGRA